MARLGRWGAVFSALVLAGVGIRLVFLFVVGDLQPVADESNYLYLSLILNRFSIYSDLRFYLWPPGYTAYLALFLKLYQVDGIFAAKLGQVLLSGVVGSTVILLARRLFDVRAALAAGVLWCVYLPLIAYTHYLWPEIVFLSLFVPAVYLFVAWLQAGQGGEGRIIAAGLLLGLSLMIKEAVLPVIVILPMIVLWNRRGSGLRASLREASLLLLAVLCTTLPWTIRNWEVYGRFVPAGATLGQNFYWGVNRELAHIEGLNPEDVYDESDAVFRWFLLPPDEDLWHRSRTANVIDGSAEDVRRGLSYASNHPGYVARQRIKQMADWATPLSFFVRHQRYGLYSGFMTKPLVRRSLLLAALTLTGLVLAGSVPGLFISLASGPARWSVGTIILCFLAEALLVGMSRYRVPIEPLLIVLTAGFICDTRSIRGAGRGALLAVGAGWTALGLLWAINSKEILMIIQEIW